MKECVCVKEIMRVNVGVRMADLVNVCVCVVRVLLLRDKNCVCSGVHEC